jgi:hypothetical protein
MTLNKFHLLIVGYFLKSDWTDFANTLDKELSEIKKENKDIVIVCRADSELGIFAEEYCNRKGYEFKPFSPRYECHANEFAIQECDREMQQYISLFSARSCISFYNEQRRGDKELNKFNKDLCLATYFTNFINI